MSLLFITHIVKLDHVLNLLLPVLVLGPLDALDGGHVPGRRLERHIRVSKKSAKVKMKFRGQVSRGGV